MSDFGDIEPEDVYDGSGERADPLQVAIRLHESRRWVGSGEPRWEDLSDDARELAVALIRGILDWLHREGTRP